ncbi:MAG: hypothetical protein Fur0042_11330 [Cyanophyceae cyanobacterium]
MDTQPFNATTSLSGLTHRLSELGFDQLPVAAAGYFFSPFSGNPVAMAGALLELGETVRPWVSTFLDRNGPALQAWVATQNPADVGRWIKGLDLSGLDDAFGGILGGINLDQVGDWVGGLDLGNVDLSNLDLGSLNLQNLGTDWLTGALRFGRSAAPRDRLAIIDGAVGDLDTLLAGIDRSTTDVLILDPTQDGIAQISTALNGRSGLRAIDLISHGESGSLQLGSSTLDLAALGDRAAELATWATAIAPGADLHLYGCNVAAGATGEAFLQQLHQQLGADIAASDDLSGYGGDWDFERFIGQIETDVAVSRNLLAAYRDTLATITVNSTADTIANDGATTLREAIISINAGSNLNGVVATGAYGTGDTIVFDPAVFSTSRTINLSLGPVEGVTAVDATVGDLDITRNVTITGPGANLLTIRSANDSRVFHINGNRTATLSGMTITGGSASYAGSGAGIYIDSSGGNVTLSGISIEGSQTTAQGSALFVEQTGSTGTGGNLTIRQSSILNNAGAGGNKATMRINRGNVVIENSTFSGNTTSDSGIVRLQNTQVTLNVRHSTFYGAGAANFDRAIVTEGGGATPITNPEGRNYIVTNSIIKNFSSFFGVSGVTGGGGSSETNGSIAGTIVDLNNATLVNGTHFSTTLALNGGTTKTHALLAPAAGNPAVNVVTASVGVDQRGTARPAAAGQGDAGAFELVVSAAPVISLKDNGGAVVDPFFFPMPAMKENNPAPGVTGLDRPRTLTFDPATAPNATSLNANVDLAIAVDDADSPSITVGLGGINGTINLNDAALGGLTVTGDNSNAVTLTGSPAGISTALRGLVFTPTAYFANTFGGAAPQIGIAVQAVDGANTVNETYNIEVENEATAPILTPTNTTVTGATATQIAIGNLFNPVATRAAARDADANSAETVGAWRANTAADTLTFTPGLIIFDGVPGGVTVRNGVTVLSSVGGPDMAGQLGFEQIDGNGDRKDVYEINIANLPNLTFEAAAVQSFPVKFYLWSRENNVTSRYTGLEQEITVNVTGVNTAPAFAVGFAPALPPTFQAPFPSAGEVVSTLFPIGLGAVVDNDTGAALAGIAIAANAADPLTEGAWQYSSDGGTTWQNVGVVSAAAALVVKADSRLRFLPVAGFSGTAPTLDALTVHALDNTYLGGFSNSTGLGTPVTLNVAAANGGTTPISATTVPLGASVTANVAPVISGNGSLGAVVKNTANPTGVAIATLLPFGTVVTDTGPEPTAPPANRFTGLAVVANSAPGTEGVWQYSSNGTDWSPIGAVTPATAKMISVASQVRFVPAAGYTGTPTPLTVRAVDNTYTGGFSISGAVETPVARDVSANGTTTPFSVATGQLQISVIDNNVAPVFTGPAATLAAIAAGTANPPGNTVTALFGGIVTDPDVGSALTGVAIVGNSAIAATQGTWQYSTDGTSWFDVGAVADDATALALSATSRLRFVPAAGFTGAPPSLTVRAIDNTFVNPFTVGATRQLANATANGGANAISGNIAALNTSITAVVVPPPPPVPTPTPAPAPAPPSSGNLVVTIAGGGPLSDGTPNDVALGAIAPGAVFETTLTLQNSTANTTTLGAIQLPTGFVLGNPLPSSLGPGQQANIRLLFGGTVPGTYKGIIGIPTNGVPDGLFNFPVVIAIDPNAPAPSPTPPGEPGTPVPTPPGEPGVPPVPPGPGPSPGPSPNPGPAPSPTPDPGGEPPVPPVPPGGPSPLPLSVLPAIDLLDFQLGTGIGAGLANLLFDPNFYLAQAPQAAAEVAAGLAQDLFDHYVKFGQFAGLSPSGAFDEALYRQLNPDIVPLIGGPITSGFDHYVKFGQFENRYTPLLLFDLGYYLAANPDLRGTIAPTDVAAGLGHFLSTGQKAGLNPSALFDAAFYAQRHPEALAAVQGGQAAGLFDYFVKFGLRAGHVPTPAFDGAQYLLDNPEAQGAIAAGQFSGPFEHYLIRGIGQGRGQGALLFDADFYVANHPQVAQGIAQGDFLDAYDQFIRFGQFAGWQPSPTFEEQTYLRNNPDVKAQVDAGTFETGVEHYILFGRAEGRKGMA